VVLEAIYIKKFQPKYNVLGKDDKSWNYLVITNDDFPKLKPIRIHDLKQIPKPEQKKSFAKIFGPFPHLRTKETLKILQKLFHISLCEPNQKRPCIYYEMGQCLGVCTGEISAADYKRKVINPLSLFLNGKKKTLLVDLAKNMKAASKNNQFEEAARIRDQIGNLTHIHDITLIDKTFIDNITLRVPSTFTQVSVDEQGYKSFRIEGYDISNLGTSGLVGSLVVFQNGEPQKSGYKRFRIRTVIGQSDVDSLAEVLTRRLKHHEWPFPDYILVDGGKPQVNRARKVLNYFKISIPVIGIAKGPARKKNEFIFDPEDAAFVAQNEKTLIQARDEAHRFAINYQRQTRKIK